MIVLGVDVAGHQGPNLDWKQIEDAGVRFAILKATQGKSIKDSTFEKNYERASAAGLDVGAYHWLSPSDDPKVQAAYLLNAVAGKKLRHRVACDFEDPGFKALGKKEATRRAEIFIKTAQDRTGALVECYTGKWFMMECATDSAFLADCPLWHAEYPSTKRGGATAADYKAAVAALPAGGPHIASVWESRGRAAVKWQFDGDKGLLLPQKIDSDFNLFLGDEAAYAAYLDRGVLPTPPPKEVPFVPTALNVQKVLAALGYLTAADVDGFDGPKTRGAVKAFQKDRGLFVDGVVGSQSTKALAAEWKRLGLK